MVNHNPRRDIIDFANHETTTVTDETVRVARIVVVLLISLPNEKQQLEHLVFRGRRVENHLSNSREDSGDEGVIYDKVIQKVIGEPSSVMLMRRVRTSGLVTSSRLLKISIVTSEEVGNEVTLVTEVIVA